MFMTKSLEVIYVLLLSSLTLVFLLTSLNLHFMTTWQFIENCLYIDL